MTGSHLWMQHFDVVPSSLSPKLTLPANDSIIMDFARLCNRAGLGVEEQKRKREFYQVLAAT